MNFMVAVFAFALWALMVYGFVRLSIWVIKTAVKQALREYDQEKRSGSQEH